jgi:hypothetical protein
VDVMFALNERANTGSALDLEEIRCALAYLDARVFVLNKL